VLGNTVAPIFGWSTVFWILSAWSSISLFMLSKFELRRNFVIFYATKEVVKLTDIVKSKDGAEEFMRA
jgi:hypothetical protein